MSKSFFGRVEVRGDKWIVTDDAGVKYELYASVDRKQPIRLKSLSLAEPGWHPDTPTMRWCWGTGWVLGWGPYKWVVLGSGRGRDMTVNDLKEWAVREIVDNHQWQVSCGSLIHDLRGMVFRVQRDGYPDWPVAQLDEWYRTAEQLTLFASKEEP